MHCTCAYMYMHMEFAEQLKPCGLKQQGIWLAGYHLPTRGLQALYMNSQSVRQCIAKQLHLKTTPFFSREKEELPQVGTEPVTFCVVGRQVHVYVHVQCGLSLDCYTCTYMYVVLENLCTFLSCRSCEDITFF